MRFQTEAHFFLHLFENLIIIRRKVVKMYKQFLKKFIIVPLMLAVLFLISLLPILGEGLRSLLLTLPHYLLLSLDFIYSLLLFIWHTAFYILQLILTGFHKLANTLPLTRDFMEYFKDTPTGRLLRNILSLIFNKNHRLEAQYAWRKFCQQSHPKER